MLDSARIQEEEALYKSRKQRRRGERNGEAQPLYTTLDALNSLDFFTEVPGFEEPHTLAEGIRMTFFDSGHILGAAAVLFELEENGYRRRVLFSGDLGYSGRIILRDPARPPHADVVVMETTYGDRRHKELAPSIEELYQAVTETLDRGGNVLIPSFALERSQEIIYYLREGSVQGKVPRNMRVFLDSPMAISATEIFRRHPECYDAETSELFRSGQDPFDLPGLHFTRETADSMSLNKLRGGAVIIAGSGMCTGGRIRHHLKHNLWRREAGVVFVGYAARGTLARRIIDGAEKVTLFGEEIVVRAGIHTIGGFSAHADQDELLAWYRRTGGPETTFLVHGEEESMTVFAEFLHNTRVEMPHLHQEYDLLNP